MRLDLHGQIFSPTRIRAAVEIDARRTCVKVLVAWARGEAKMFGKSWAKSAALDEAAAF